MLSCESVCLFKAFAKDMQLAAHDREDKLTAQFDMFSMLPAVNHIYIYCWYVDLYCEEDAAVDLMSESENLGSKKQSSKHVAV